MKYLSIPALLFALIISCSLFESDFFDSQTMATLFLYIGSVFLLVVYVGVILIKKKMIIYISDPEPVLYVILLSLYFFIQNIFSGKELSYKHFLLFSNCFLLIASCIVIDKALIKINSILRIVVLICGIESIVCIFQYCNILQSANIFFNVTGTVINPNVTAMFLAMGIPAILISIFSEKPFFSTISISAFILTICALFLLKCRTALVAGCIGTSIVFFLRYPVLNYLRKNISKPAILLSSCLITLFLLSLIFYGYEFKKNSADGRKLIWEISAKMTLHKPFTGYGYGMFEHDYNMFQAQYFKSELGSKEEIYNATYVRMAYNEFIEHAFEGGIIGLLLFTLFLIRLFKKPGLKKLSTTQNFNCIASYAAIVMFIVMSFLNFTMNAIPVACLFFIYVAIYINNKKIENRISFSFIKNVFNFNYIQLTKLNRGISYCFILVGLCMILSQISMGMYSIENKRAANLIKQGRPKEALQILQVIKVKLNQSSFYKNYGTALYETKDYLNAVNKFNVAATYVSDPNLYVSIGNCYSKLTQYNSAKSAYDIAYNMQPSKMAPKYALMQLYNNTRDIQNLKRVATELAYMRPKINSNKANFYKEQAEEILKKIELNKNTLQCIR